MSDPSEGTTRARVRRGRSLMVKLVATFVALSIVMVGAVAFLAAQRARASLEDSVYGQLGAAQQLTSQSTVRWLDEQRRNLSFAAGLLRGAGAASSDQSDDPVAVLLDPDSDAGPRLLAKEQVRDTLDYLVKETADASEMFVLDPDGKIVASTATAHEGLDQSAQQYVERGMSGQFVQPVAHSDLTDKPTIIVSTPLFDASGMVRGVLAAVLNLSRLDRIVLERTGLGEGGRSYLIDSDGEFAHAALADEASAPLTSPAIDAALAGGTGRGQYLNYAGVPVVGAYTFIPDIGTALISEITQEQAFAPATRLATTIAIIGVIVVILMGLIIFFASRRIAAPILAITQTAVAVRGGDLTKEAPVTTKDEVGVLAETFNDMTAQLRENVETLERRVDERTAELNTQKAYFEALVEISPAAVVTMDMDQHVTGWNPAATRLFGYQPDEALGRPIDELVLGTRDMVLEGAQLARASAESGRHDLITKRTTKDGTLVDVEIIMVPLIVNEVAVGWYAVYHDISELQEAREAADQANEAKSTFLATMSHEIRTPMNAIIGMSGLLADTGLDDEQREYTGIIQNSGEALLSIINDILDFSKIEAGRMDLENEPFSLRSCVEAVLDLMSPLALRKKLELAYTMSPATPERIVGDANRVRQVLLNLVSNAVKFTDSGHVRMSIDAFRVAEDHTTRIAIAVTDTGIGLTPEQAGRLFQSFSQADVSTARRYGGTGLGLAISRRLAELMGGTLQVASPGLDGAGSTFTLEIAAEAPVTVGPPPSVALSGRRIGVADASELQRALLEDLIRAWGGDVVVVEPSAIDQALTERVDAFIIDCPADAVGDGLTVVEAVGGRRPVIVTSAAPRREVVADPRSALAAAWVAKPIKPSALAAALGRTLGAGVATDGPAETERIRDVRHVRAMRVLLAEDNALNQKLAVTLLERMGHQVSVANDGAEAVQAVLAENFDVVLMDLQMPVVDGLEATRQIVQALGDARPRIVALTANAMSEDREASIAAGMDGYLTKPLRRDELAEALWEVSASLVAPGSDAEVVGVVGATTPAVGAALDEPSVQWESFRQRVREMVGGEDAAFEAELATEFVTGLPALLQTIADSAAAGDSPALERAAHTLKSHAALFGATRLERQCRALEAAAGESDLAPELVDSVLEESERVGAAVAAGY